MLALEHRLVGLNPVNGEVFWSYDMPGSAWPISIPTPVLKDDLMFFTTAHVGSVLLRLASDRPAIEVVWRRHGRKPRSVDTLNSVIPTPVVMNGHVFGVQSRGELRCLDLMSGKRKWESTEVMPKASHATMHLVRYGERGDRAWIFNELGELIRSFSKRTDLPDPSNEDLEKAMKELDLSGDGKIQKDEMARIVVHVLMSSRK